MMLGALERLEHFTGKVSVQPMAQPVLGSIPDFDGKDKTATIPWLDQVEQVTERTCNDPVEVGISKLKGLTLGDTSMVRKEEGLMWHKFCQILIQNYSNVPYVSNAMVVYNNLTQDDESNVAKRIRAKVLLEHINHTYTLSQMSGKGLNNLALVQGLRDHHIRRRVTQEQKSWNMMEDVYRSIKQITKNEARTRAYQETWYESISEVLSECIHDISYNRGKIFSCNGPHNSSIYRKQHNNNTHQRYHPNTHPYPMSMKMQCYYCDGEHSIDV